MPFRSNTFAITGSLWNMTFNDLPSEFGAQVIIKIPLHIWVMLTMRGQFWEGNSKDLSKWQAMITTRI